MQERQKVLIADDNRGFREQIARELRKQGYRVSQVEDSSGLRRIIERERFGVILLDLRMPDKDGNYSEIAGIEDLKYLKNELRLKDCAIIVVSVDNDTRVDRETMRFGAFDIFSKAEISRDQAPLVNAINGAFAELKAKSRLLEHAPRNKAREEIEAQCKLQFSVVPTGIYRQFGRGPFAEGLVQHSISNHSDREIKVTLTTWIEKWSDHQISTIKVESHRTEYISSNPLIHFDRARRIKDVEEATLQHSISYVRDGKERRQILDSENIWLHPISTMCWALENPETSRSHFLGNYIAAWVTPHSTPVQQMLRVASKLHPNEFIIGYRGGELFDSKGKAELTRAQVRAMYQALRSQGGLMRVDASSITYRGRGSQALQQVRLPDECLEHRVANCIDASVLFASLIEAAGMHPVIVLVPGHAFVGWETWEESGRFEYLEPLLLNREPFEEAMRQGCARFEQETALKGFTTRGSERISIHEARREGIYPMITR